MLITKNSLNKISQADTVIVLSGYTRSNWFQASQINPAAMWGF